MGLIEYYLIFCLTTAIVALIDVFGPALRTAQADGVKNVLTENPKLSMCVYLCITTIMAPFIILPLLVPSMHERFKTSLTQIIREED